MKSATTIVKRPSSPDLIKLRYVVEYTDPILSGSAEHKPGERAVIGRTRQQCEVELTIHADLIAATLGYKACHSKGGKAKDGLVIVRRKGKPKETEREVYESAATEKQG